MVSVNAVDEIVSCILPLPHFLVNLLVLVLSLRRVRHSIIKIFALNLTVPSLVFSLYATVAAICRFTGHVDHLGVSDVADPSVLDYCTDFVYYFCGYDYRILGILLLAVTYVSFARPMFAMKHFRDRTIHTAFSLAHVFAVFASFVSTFSTNQTELFFLKNVITPVNWTDYLEGSLEALTFTTFVVLYAVCMKAMFVFKRRTLGSTEALKNDKILKKHQLLMILLYITPPNILLIPNSLCTDVNTVVFRFDNAAFRHLCHIKIHFHSSLLAVRLFIASFTILIAFTDYRQALMGILRRANKKSSKTGESAVEVIAAQMVMVSATEIRPKRAKLLTKHNNFTGQVTLPAMEITVGGIITTVLPIPHIFLNILVIYLSLKHVRHSTMRTYALNLTIPSVAYSLYSMAVVVLRYLHMEKHFGMRSSDSGQDIFLDYATDCFIYFCGYDYRFLAIILVVITYTNFEKPIFAKKHLKSRNVIYIFLVGHMFAIFFSVVTAISDNQGEHLLKSGTAIPVNWSDYFEAFGETGTFLIFVTSYVVCLQAIISFNRKQKVIHQSSSNNQRSFHLRAQLLAILLYITPPNVFLIPSSVCTDLFTTFIPSGTPFYHQMCILKIFHFESFLAGRLFVASGSILFAFVDYRRAVLSFLNRNQVFTVAHFGSSMHPEAHHTNNTSSTINKP